MKAKNLKESICSNNLVRLLVLPLQGLGEKRPNNLYPLQTRASNKKEMLFISVTLMSMLFFAIIHGTKQMWTSVSFVVCVMPAILGQNNLVFMWNHVFSDYPSLASISNSNQHKKQLEIALFLNRSLNFISIPKVIMPIRSYMLSSCSTLESVVIPSSITKIGEKVFCWCSSLMTISTPSNAKEISSNAFESRASLKNPKYSTNVHGRFDWIFFQNVSIIKLSIR